MQIAPTHYSHDQLLNGGAEIFQNRSADGLETSGDVGTQAN